MVTRATFSLCSLILLFWLPLRANAEELSGHPFHHEAMILPVMEEAEDVLAGWLRDSDWLVSPVRDEGGTRVATMVFADLGSTPRIQARGIDSEGTTSWVDALITWSGAEGLMVLAADLDRTVLRSQLRLHAPSRHDLGAVSELGWRALTPVREAGGNHPQAPAPQPQEESSAPRAVSQALLDIGVIPREAWGASSTNCTSPETEWYRFAIHHTAGNQTSGGTVQGAVQGLQGWSMGGGGFCDIPYQFVVGYDGSLWEGRNLNYYSGATGGGNNDGNIAISHLGCYHPSCTPPDSAELVMRAGGRWLAQTLGIEHGIITNTDTLKGHRDYPGNSTACPGDSIHSRLDEYRSGAAHFQGTVIDTSWEGDVAVELGATESLWVEVRNDGLETWTNNSKLAPLPRDVACPLEAASWLSSTRINGPDGDTPPGSIATFALDVFGAQEGTYDLSFALVEESVSWFSDLPIGGGPADGTMTLRVVVDDGEEETPSDDDDLVDDDDSSVSDDDDSADEEPTLGEASLVRGERQDWFVSPRSGCACNEGAPGSAGPSSWLLVGSLVWLGARTRRRRMH